MKSLITSAYLFGAAALMGGQLFAANAVNPNGPKTVSNNKPAAAAVQAKTPPPAPPDLITVQPGDSLATIAQANGTTYIRLFEANTSVTDPNLIYPGQVLRIPSADEQLPARDLPTPPPPATPDAALTAAALPAPAAPVTPPVTSSGNGVWDQLAACESGGNWAINTGNGFYGGLQFTLSSWQSVGGTGYPNQASPQEQIARAEILQSRQGWSAWPACSAKLGLS